MTNGDYFSGVNQGLTRQGQAVAGQSVIGNPEENLIFLGYPDGHLWELLQTYAGPGDALTTSFGQSTTYGERGLGSTDYHTYRFGGPALYNGANVVQDLQDIFEVYRPTDIYATSRLDNHRYGDHQATGYFVRTALLHMKAAYPTYSPTLHETFVYWDSDPPWPAAMGSPDRPHGDAGTFLDRLGVGPTFAY